MARQAQLSAEKTGQETYQNFLEETVAHMQAVIPGYRFQLQLTETGLQILSRLDKNWLVAVIRPLLLAKPAVEVFLSQQGQEPMITLAEDPKELRDIFSGDTYVGTVLAYPQTGGRQKISRVVVALPTLELIDVPADFEIRLNNSKFEALVAKAYTQLYHKVPFLLDIYRQKRNSNGRGRPAKIFPPMYANSRQEPELDSQVMWIAMHWAESGGAESWAWEQARLAKAAGFKLVFTFDRAAPQRQLQLASELSEDIYLIGQGVLKADWTSVLLGIMETHRPAHLHIHHSNFVYTQLPVLKALYPQLRVEDTTHIAEYRGGGFVGSSIGTTQWIDLHHVISPQLVELYADQQVPAQKVHYHPLTHLTSDQRELAPIQPLTHKPITLGFLGRLSAQKRPVLFIALAAILHRRYPGKFRFIMQGSGELENIVVSQLKRWKLMEVIERRPWGSIEDFLTEIDILLITSENEGLTLTSIEADAAGVPVVSTNVGSQYSVVSAELLLPREPIGFIKGAIALLKKLADDPQFYQRVSAGQRQLTQILRSQVSASEFYRQHYQALLTK
ncbi:glycosyltransferase [Gleimia sp. 6138-11-ORH1]|uniref:glycosyltransferase n=1 Tax=Gleimia sp. 6138-11-ORH1 TaxID=2973937 RepID=UPI0021687486|nr:glycosyltransferase [Gleimia sp. 6138-11-ORH1]MCS4484043.1 glycosyltransferase [Gleimia sp. 6138-11-ORH1]